MESESPLMDATEVGESEVGILEHAQVIWQHRRMILSLLVVAVLTTLIYSFAMPKTYESTATLFAPREASNNFLTGLAAASGILQQIPGLSVPSMTPNRDLLVSVLRSRTVAQTVVERFGLQERYQQRYLEDAIKQLQNETIVALSREGVISVKVADRDPRTAAQMANLFVEQLDRLVARYGMGEAGHQRGFLTEQLARTKVDLGAAEVALRRFQERNRAIVLQDQTKGAIEAAAKLKGEIIAGEVQLQVMRNFATEMNPEVVAVRRRIEEMTRQLSRMQYGDDVGQRQEPREFVVPFSRVPEVGLELARLTRDVKVQETLMTILAQQVEQARIAEAKDIPVVQVLDRAVPAERHSKPRLVLNVAIATVTSLLGGIFLAFVHDYVRKVARKGRTA